MGFCGIGVVVGGYRGISVVVGCWYCGGTFVGGVAVGAGATSVTEKRSESASLLTELDEKLSKSPKSESACALGFD